MIQSEFAEAQRKRVKFGWSINQCKDYLQNLAIRAWLVAGGIGMILAFTGFGKTVLATKVIKKFLTKYPDDRVIICVPTTPLHTQWLRTMKQFGKSVDVYVINTLTMTEGLNLNCGLFILDEIHHAANEDSKFFSKAIGMVKFRKFLGLSATVDDKQMEFLDSTYNVKVNWEITLEEGKALKILPKYLLCNIGVDLTESEKATYFQINKNYTYYLNKFSTAYSEKAWDLASACGKGKTVSTTLKVGDGRFGRTLSLTGPQWREYVADKYEELGFRRPTDGEVYSWARGYNTSMSARNAVIYRSQNKHRMMLFLLKNIHKNIMVFTTTTKILHWWKSDETVEYHSNIKPESLRKANLQTFCVTKRIILSCSALKEGYDNAKVGAIINHDYTSKVRDIEQIIGRALRPDEDDPTKTPVIVNLFCKPFKYQDAEIVTQDYQRLMKAQKRLQGVEELKLNELMTRL